MGAKNEVYNQWLKDQKAGKFEGTFEDYMSTNYGGQIKGGEFVPDEPKQETLGGSYNNWTQVAEAYYPELDPVATMKMALAMQSANPGTNVWSPGQTINVPPLGASRGVITDEEWARQKERETGEGYFDWQTGQPTEKYWQSQAVTQGGYTRTRAARELGYSPSQPITGAGQTQQQAQGQAQGQPRVEQGMSDVALAWNTFLGPYYQSRGMYTDINPELGVGSPQALGPQNFQSGMGTTYTGAGQANVPVEQMTTPMAGAVGAAMRAAGLQTTDYQTQGAPQPMEAPDIASINPMDADSMAENAPPGYDVIPSSSGSYYVYRSPDGRIVPLSQLTPEDYTTYAQEQAQSSFPLSGIDPVEEVKTVIKQFPQVVAALENDDTSMLTDQQLAVLVQFGLWEPADASAAGKYTLPEPDSRYEYYGGTYLFPGGQETPVLPPTTTPYYSPSSYYNMPTGYQGRALYWGLMNWRF